MEEHIFEQDRGLKQKMEHLIIETIEQTNKQTLMTIWRAECSVN